MRYSIIDSKLEDIRYENRKLLKSSQNWHRLYDELKSMTEGFKAEKQPDYYMREKNSIDKLMDF